MLRRLHDATAGSELAGGQEVVCHNDPSPCNYVFVDGRPAAFIDFDHAAPGDRLRDVAYAGWLWTMSADDGPPLPEQARRLRLMADTYGLSDTSVLLDAVLLRQEENLAAALARSQSPDPAVAEHGHASATWQRVQMAARPRRRVPRGADHGRQPGRLSRVFAVVITGPPGAGKTSVLTALVNALSDDDIAHAAIEVEMLVWTHPALTDEQWARHLRMACELYREAGHRLLLVAQTLETDADVAELLDAVGADEVFLVRLEAEPASLVERIIEREPPSWSGLSGIVQHAQELAGTMPGLAGVDLVLSTEGERAEDVAAGIRAAWPDWLS